MIVSPRGYPIGRSDDDAPKILTNMPRVPFVLLYELKRTPPIISSPPSGDFIDPSPPRPAPVIPDQSPSPPFGSQDIFSTSPPKNKAPVKQKTAKPVPQKNQFPSAPPQNSTPPRPKPNEVVFPSPPKNTDPDKLNVKPVPQSKQVPTAPLQTPLPPRQTPCDVQYCQDQAAFNGYKFQNPGNLCGLNSCINGMLECLTIR